MEDYPGGVVNHVCVREISGNFYLFVSRNMNYVNMFQISVDDEGNFSFFHVKDIQVGKNCNCISFGYREYSDCIVK